MMWVFILKHSLHQGITFTENLEAAILDQYYLNPTYTEHERGTTAPTEAPWWLKHATNIRSNRTDTGLFSCEAVLLKF